jgi:hypothetical protein
MAFLEASSAIPKHDLIARVGIAVQARTEE